MATNKAMRLGSAMLVLALITTCAIATTFAKYTTSATGNDTARVAYWGWTNTSGYLSSSADLNLFATSYAKDDTTATSANTVLSSNSQNVVAPGTEGKVVGCGTSTRIPPLKPPMPITLRAPTPPL